MSKKVLLPLFVDTEEFFKNFPFRIKKNEANYEGYSYKGNLVYTTTYKNGARIKNTDFTVTNIGNSLLTAFNEAIKADSIANYISKRLSRRNKYLHLREEWDKTPIKDYDFFDPIPLGVVVKTPSRMSKAHLEAYMRRRVVFSLTKICSSNPPTFFNRGKFISWLAEDAAFEDSTFMRAVKIEPCLIQTELGQKIQREELTFWNREKSRILSNALRPSNKDQKQGKLTTDTQRGRLIQVMLTMRATAPHLLNLTSTELQDALVSHGFLGEKIDSTDFNKLRRLVTKA